MHVGVLKTLRRSAVAQRFLILSSKFYNLPASCGLLRNSRPQRQLSAFTDPTSSCFSRNLSQSESSFVCVRKSVKMTDLCARITSREVESAALNMILINLHDIQLELFMFNNICTGVWLFTSDCTIKPSEMHKLLHRTTKGFKYSKIIKIHNCFSCSQSVLGRLFELD